MPKVLAFAVLAAPLVFALAACAARPGSARLPWAATSGVHFVEAVVEADNYRVAAAGVALKRSPSPMVRELARRVWLDTIENRRRLVWTLTRWRPYAFLPDRVSPRKMFVIDRLLFAKGNAFDRRYIAQQEASLKEVLALTEGYSKLGDDFDMKEYANRALPRIRMRLEEVRVITRHLEETAPQG
jgi:putative membrane protein